MQQIPTAKGVYGISTLQISKYQLIDLDVAKSNVFDSKEKKLDEK